MFLIKHIGIILVIFFLPPNFLKIPNDQKEETDKIKSVAKDFQILFRRNKIFSQLLVEYYI